MNVDSQFMEANALLRQGRFGEAEKRYRALTRVRPIWAYANLGTLYMQIGRDKEAELALRTALRLDPKLASPRYTLALQLLRTGRYLEAWPFWEARRELPEFNIRTPNVTYPEWTGQDLAGKHLVVVLEQGQGDQIQYARFLPQLRRMGARVTFVCRPSLAPLFAGMDAEIRPASAGMPAEADYWVLILSLGLRLGVTLKNLPAGAYLPGLRLTSGGGIGVAVKGSPTHKNDRHRSLPDDLAEQVSGFGRNLAPEATGAQDFRDTAEIVAGLDLVISVDTSVAHLAAAMGKPTWVLIPAIDTDWRWLRGRSDSPWYPTARLLRQPGPGRWDRVVRQIESELQESGLRP